AHRANIVNGAFNYVGLGVVNSGGTLYVTQIFMEAAPGSVAAVSIPSPLPPADIRAERTSGADRFATAAAISQESFPSGASTAFVAIAFDFPDALSAGPAAADRRAPVLLTSRDSVPPATLGELRRLGPQQVVLVGGPSAISDSVGAEIRSATGAEVIRLSGASRFETAAAIARFFATGSDLAYVATGRGFPDALAGGAAAAHLGAPILLTDRDVLPEATAAVLREIGPTEIVVLGGDAAVSPAVMDALRNIAPNVRRIAGADRFATASAIAADAFPGSLSATYLATGANFPDALAGAAAAGLAGSPLMLTQRDCVPASVRALIDARDPDRLVLLGGQAAIGDAVAALVSC
ncbi:MAG: cell wall-binding repeat-containing protein, partial [Acidimicrobiia bacterium]